MRLSGVMLLITVLTMTGCQSGSGTGGSGTGGSGTSVRQSSAALTSGPARSGRPTDESPGLMIGHSVEVTSMAYAPDGASLAVVEGYRVEILDVNTGVIRETLTGHTGLVHAVVFSPDGSAVATASADHTVRIWNVATSRVTRTLSHPDEVGAVTFAPDGRSVATACWDGKTRLWDVTTGQLRQTLSRNGSTIVHTVVFTPDGGQIAVAAHVSGHDEVQFWTAATGAAGRTLVAGAEHEIGQLVFAPDGKTLAVVGQLGETALTVFWDLATGKPGRTRPSSSVAYASDGKTVATAEGGGRVMLRDPSNGEALHTLSTGEDSITEVVFAPGGRTLATAGESVRTWDYPRLTQLVKVPVRGGSVVGIAFSPDGATLVSKGDTTLRIWDVSTGHLTRTIPGFWDWSSRVEYAANGKMVAALVKSGPSKAEMFSLGMVDTVVNTASATITAGASDAAAPRTWGGAAFPVLNFALMPDSRSAAVGTVSPSSIEIRDLTSGQVSATFVCTQQEYGIEDGCAPTFSLNGATLAGVPNDEKGKVQIWDVASRKLVRTLVAGARVNQVAFTPDGRSVAIASEDRVVHIWDVATGTAKALTGHADAVYSVAFSPDGTTVVTGGADRGVLVWNVATSKLLHTFTGHAGPVNAVTFAPNGRTIASASDDGTIRLWPR